jgi:3-oxoacyl-[acyl-carrier-protein] synthase-3
VVISQIEGLKIDGISAVVPKFEIDNLRFAKDLFNVEDDTQQSRSVESLIKSIGIEKRRVCMDNVTSLDLGVRAAKELFKAGSFKADDFGGIVFVTETPDDLCPNNSSYIQHILGFPENTAVLDINHACPGYIYGLWVAGLMASNIQKKVLLLVAETNSYFVSPHDRATAPLFGDAGTATIVSPSSENRKWSFVFQTDGSKRDVLLVPGFGYREKPSTDKLEYISHPDGSKRRRHDLYMDGQAVFSYVTQRASKYIKRFLEELKKTSDDYDYLVLHQANAFMLKMLAMAIKFPTSKMPLSLQKYGNTNSASIPLNIVSEIGKTIREKESKLLMSGFGAGLATGIADINLGPCVCPEVIEYE